MITIIVLLILAGIAINSVIDNNGALNQTKDAKLRARIADIKDDLQLALINTAMRNDGNVTVQLLLDELLREGIIESTDIISVEPENDPMEAWIEID